jgi:hypothetical protein
LSTAGQPHFTEPLEARLERNIPGATLRHRRAAPPDARFVVELRGKQLAVAASGREAVYRAEALREAKR